MSDSVIKIYTDGACLGNPGPGGWGAVLMYKNREKELSGAEAYTTNNRMELTAAIEALATIRKKQAIHFVTDSRYLKDGIIDWLPRWKQNRWRTSQRKPVRNQDLWQRLDELIPGFDIDWCWVRGHSGHVGNGRADALAREGVARFLADGTVRDESTKNLDIP